MMLRGGYDEPRGIIIGGYEFSGQLTYDGRPQGNRLYADSEEKLMELARKLKHELIAPVKDILGIYDDDSKWILRIWP